MTERYEIIKLIGKDPAGGVYLAEDTTLERKVTFRNIDNAELDAKGKSWKEAFSTYSGKLCALQHPNLLTIYDIFVEGDGVSVVSQFIEGESLAECLEQGPLSQQAVYRMASDLLEGLHAAHASEVFHGALHTGSVKRLPRATGGHRYLLVDLGLNTLATMVKGEDVHIADPVLLAPELHNQENKPDVRADLFMLGQICYTALVGGHPFAEKSPEDCVEAYLAGALPPLRDYVPDVQEDFAAWVMQLATSDRDSRLGSVEEAMQSLHAIEIDEPETHVSSLTHAVQLIPAEVATSAVVNTAQIVQGYVQPKKKPYNKGLIVIGLICVLIGLALWLLMSRQDDAANGGTADGSGILADESGEAVYLREVEMINTIAKHKTPVTVNLDTESTIDWTVTTGNLTSLMGTKMDGGKCIQSIGAVGKFGEFSFKNNPIQFNAGGKDLIPKAATDSRKSHKAKIGAGWETQLRIPIKHRGPITVSFYLLQVGCGFDVAVTLPDGKQVVKLAVPMGGRGVIKMPIRIPRPEAGGFYRIKVTASSVKKKKPFSMGVFGIHVEGR